MSADPFGAGNPFGGGGGAPAESPPPKPHVHSDPTPVQEDQGVLFSDADPFGAPVPPPVSKAIPTEVPVSQAPQSPQSPQSPGRLDTADLGVKTSDLSKSDASSTESSSPKAPNLTDQSIGDWKHDAIELCRKIEAMTHDEKKASAVHYAAKHKIRLEQSLIREADRPEGLVKMCNALRIAPCGFRYQQLNRVEVEGATRNPGKGMEFPFWTYTFKVHTTLPEYKDQPRYDGQKNYVIIKNLVVLSTERRYRDFEWLRRCLVLENPGVLVPPIPEKTLQSIKEKLGKKGEDSFAGAETMEAGQEKGKWQADSDASNCNGCNAAFGLVTRKHHCRHCMKIFCSACCPKPAGGKRFCNDCASLKGLAEMLMKSPDVAFRMKGLHMFLSECMNGPLATSETLRFFLEAPQALLNGKKDKMLKDIEQAHQVCSKSAGDVAREKFGGVQSWFSGGTADMAGLSPRGQARRHHVNRLQCSVESFTVFRDQMSDQLFEGLRRKQTSIPSLSSQFAGDAYLKVLTEATEHVDASLAQFKNVNKELMFLIVGNSNFLIGLLQAMIETLAEMDRHSKMKKHSVGNPEKMGQLNSFLDEQEEVVQREMQWLSKYTAVTYKILMDTLWRLERNRDPGGYDWSKTTRAIDGLKDPKF